MLVCSRSLRVAYFLFTDDEVPRPTTCDVLRFVRHNEAAPLRSLVLADVMRDVGAPLPDDVMTLRSLTRLDLAEDVPQAAAFLHRVDFPVADAYIHVVLRHGAEVSTSDARAIAASLRALVDTICLPLVHADNRFRRLTSYECHRTFGRPRSS